MTRVRELEDRVKQLEKDMRAMKEKMSQMSPESARPPHCRYPPLTGHSKAKFRSLRPDRVWGQLDLLIENPSDDEKAAVGAVRKYLESFYTATLF